VPNALCPVKLTALLVTSPVRLKTVGLARRAADPVILPLRLPANVPLKLPTKLCA